ncbi:hypothetical protein OS189_00325 [Sulfitobacter sp. F26169L]|uniref:hypothetical protein n=1 Tax=Sulfitobacter sp. F26169L TaxID=2996015 RepID=UPI002260BFAD|nr:hypothetical protein [Sulfitobacter sp. F26169L]MCX7564785.1 hypothetical protein [Sulfitobacter sp. F26169L]
MSVRFVLGVCAVAALTACQPAAPEDSRFGVGFDQTFDAQRANRDAMLAGSVPAAPSVSAQPLPVAGSPADTAAQTTAMLARTGRAQTVADAGRLAAAANNSGVPPVEASPSNPAPGLVNNATGISQENNFDVVTNQRSIESDAARLAANRAQYQVIQPQALPERTDTGPNIVAYALKTSHPVGTKMYKRSRFNAANRFKRSCGNYRHMDQAQADFLTAGGPERDPKGMDPDGDGYACGWNPAVYRTIGD